MPGLQNLLFVCSFVSSSLPNSTDAQKDQDLAHSLSSRLNEAYQCLLNPLSRAEYILERNGVHISESDHVEDMEFMADIMEQREAIEEAGSEDSEAVHELVEANDGAWPVEYRFIGRLTLSCSENRIRHPRLDKTDRTTGLGASQGGCH